MLLLELGGTRRVKRSSDRVQDVFEQVGCNMLGGEEAGPGQLSADGSFVLAPKDGGLFTMSVEGPNVKIVKSECSAK